MWTPVPSAKGNSSSAGATGCWQAELCVPAAGISLLLARCKPEVTRRFRLQVPTLSGRCKHTPLFPRDQTKQLSRHREKFSSSIPLAPISPNPPSPLGSRSPRRTRLGVTPAPHCQGACFAQSSSAEAKIPSVGLRDCCWSGSSDKKALVAIQWSALKPGSVPGQKCHDSGPRVWAKPRD